MKVAHLYIIRVGKSQTAHQILVQKTTGMGTNAMLEFMKDYSSINTNQGVAEVHKPENFDGETAEGTRCLIDRNVKLRERKGIKKITVYSFETFTRNLVLLEEKKFGDLSEDEQKVGVYIVGHAKSGMGTLAGMSPDEVAFCLHDLIKVKHIHKLCLLVCNAGEEKKLPEEELKFMFKDSLLQSPYSSYLVALCEVLGLKGYPGIKVAGWSSFVTIISKEAKLVKGSHRKDKNYGKKAAPEKGENSAKKGIINDVSRSLFKKYYTWTVKDGVSAIDYQDWHDN